MAKMTLMFRAAIDGKYPYLPAVQTANGRVEPKTAIYQARKRTFDSGKYYLRLSDDGRQTHEAVGSDPSLAVQRQIERRGQLDAKAAGLHVETPVVQQDDPPKPGLAEVIQKYLVETEGNKSKGTLACYRNTMTLFQQSCKKAYVDEITREDMLGFKKYLRARDKSDLQRYSYNHFLNAAVFLKWAKVKTEIKKSDWPPKNERDPEAYEDKEMLALCKGARSG